jgi:hypothetical protein
MRFIVFAEDKSEIEELLSDNFVNIECGKYFVRFAVVEWLDNITIFRALDQK